MINEVGGSHSSKLMMINVCNGKEMSSRSACRHWPERWTSFCCQSTPAGACFPNKHSGWHGSIDATFLAPVPARSLFLSPNTSSDICRRCECFYLVTIYPISTGHRSPMLMILRAPPLVNRPNSRPSASLVAVSDTNVSMCSAMFSFDQFWSRTLYASRRTRGTSYTPRLLGSRGACRVLR